MFLVALKAGEFAALALGIFGVAGVIFTALKYNRDDTTAVVNQQAQIVGTMKTLNEELRTTADSLRTEVQSLRGENEVLHGQVEGLTAQVEAMRRELHEGMTGLHDKIDEANGDT